MLSLTKKSDAEPVAAPPWHANFRNFERLPDTKVVRTTFFINTAAIAIAVGMALWLTSREYTNHSLRDQIAEAKRQIEANTKQNAEALRLSKVFLDEQKKIDDAAAFTKVPITVLEFVDQLAQTMPKEIIVDNVDSRIVDAKNSVYQVRGRIAGSPDQASGLISSYVDMLRVHPRISTVFEPITLNRIDRNVSGTYMLFDISFSVKPEKK
jgi:hypothetical protein